MAAPSSKLDDSTELVEAVASRVGLPVRDITSAHAGDFLLPRCGVVAITDVAIRGRTPTAE
jgi:hypothetical protein